jgi:outer membrane protein assembly factor BamB
MLCFRNVNQILILDAESKQVVWSFGAGHLERPHHPTMLDNGHILIFDNGTQRRYSRVIEIEPVRGNIVWQYTADPPQEFFTEQKGSSQRLANGNTLICQGDSGRVFEVTPEGEVVWEWKNPAVIWERSDPMNPKSYRAALYRMMRLEPRVVEPLLQQRRPQ